MGPLLRHSRNLYYLAMIMLFLILAPVMVLYTMGYRLDSGARKLVQTGVLVVASTPSKAIVQMNGTVQEQRTTAHIDAIKTGTYDVRVTKDGYQPWEKSLPIHPGRSTIADDIVLFHAEATSRAVISDSSMTDARMLSGQRFLFVTQEETSAMLQYWYADDAAPIALGTFSGSLTILGIHNPAHRVLLQHEDTDGVPHYVMGDLSPYLNTQSPAREPMHMESLDVLIPQKPDALAWDQRDGTLLWARYGTTLVRIDVFHGTRVTIAHDVQDILASPQGLVYLAQRNGALYLVREKTQSSHDIDIALAATDSRLLAAQGNRFVMSNHNGTVLYDVPRPGVVITQQLAGPVDHAVWQEKNRLLLWSASELTVYDATTHRVSPVARFADPILAATWAGRYAYVVFMQRDKIIVSEIDTRDRLNTIQNPVPRGTEFRGISDDASTIWLYTPRTDAPSTLWRLQVR